MLDDEKQCSRPLSMLLKDVPVKLSNYNVKTYGVRERSESGNSNLPTTLRLRIIDTPGLGDNRVGEDETLDMQHITNVLRMLAWLSGPDRLPWEKTVHGVILMAPWTGYFGGSAQKTVRFYRDCMPGLFRQLAMINTRFGYCELFQTHEDMRSGSFGGSATIDKRGSCEAMLITHRLAMLKETLAVGLPEGYTFDAPRVFYIGNKPDPELPFEDMRSRNKLSAILETLSAQLPMEISQMSVPKDENMLAVDRQLRSHLETIRTRLQLRRDEIALASTDGVSARKRRRGELQTEIGMLHNRLAQVERDPEPLDNDNIFVIGTHLTVPHVTNWRLAVSWLSSKGLTGKLLVREDKYAGFQVSAEDNATGTWTWRGWQDCDAVWRGQYCARPGKRAELEAKTYIVNRVLHAAKIAPLKALKTRLTREATELERMFARKYADAENEDHFSKENEVIGQQLLALMHLNGLLTKDAVHMDDSFTQATAELHGTTASAIGESHLQIFVQDAQTAATGKPRENLTRLLADWVSLFPGNWLQTRPGGAS